MKWKRIVQSATNLCNFSSQCMCLCLGYSQRCLRDTELKITTRLNRERLSQYLAFSQFLLKKFIHHNRCPSRNLNLLKQWTPLIVQITTQCKSYLKELGKSPLQSLFQGCKITGCSMLIFNVQCSMFNAK